LLRNEYTGLQLYCTADQLVGIPPNQVCPVTTGEQELAKLGLTYDTMWQPALILLAFGLFYRLTGLVMLQYQTNRVLSRAT